MKSPKPGKAISVSVENITPSGIWLYVKDTEYFLSYEDYPYFQDQVLRAIQDVQLLHGYHLYWPQLDVDLEIDNLEHPEKYPLRSAVTPRPKGKSKQHAAQKTGSASKDRSL